ncbi:TetR/AcrR family transcriptional regulator [Nocardia aobensis]|uniref:TetR/AcrR family transcriptional regulator n=1 Tax=Nocardia aobensis TaxID=257277 RepID=A0ABW6PEP6_9NOCA|nr:TetR/AcrR family transcriptional regulator [Nocardia elegans]MBF6451075.1 TetR/AcrR family transcriptional regulator [Nocardia elegans]
MARSADPTVRSALLESAARLLAQQGPDAVSTRRIAAEAQTSAMAVYTHFGSIGDLVAAVIEAGFKKLATMMESVEQTDDPVRDLIALLLASVEFARREPNLYQVLFVTASLGQYRRTAPAELLAGRAETFQLVIEACERAFDAGRFTPRTESGPLAYQWWSAVHGYVMLEVAGFIDQGPGTKKVLMPLLETLASGLGDSAQRLQASLDSALEVPA